MLKRSLVLSRQKLRMSKWTAPVVFGLAAFVSQPTVPAEADIASLISARAGDGEQWRSYLVSAAAGSIHHQEVVFKSEEQLTTNNGFTPATRGLVLPDGKRLVFTPDAKPVADTPDEARVTRHLKKGRIVAIERIQPPKGFTAGSILDRQASLLTPAFTEQQYTAFRKPKIEGKEIDIALAFHMLKPKIRDIGVSTMVASLINNEEGDSLALGYAATEPDYAEDSPFDSILTKPKPKRFVPKLNGKAHSWATNVLPPHVFTEKEQKCLANAIYFEAANEPLKGRAAVAQVILNRVRNPTFPDTICGVVYQNEHWRNRCQFSFACDRIPDIVWSREKYKAAKEIALAVTAGKIYLEEVGDSTHYHATYVRPAWARTMTRVSKIGLHIFYRTRNGGWT